MLSALIITDGISLAISNAKSVLPEAVGPAIIKALSIKNYFNFKGANLGNPS